MLGFALDELALNRAGLFSARQRQTLFFTSVGYLVRGLVLTVLSVVLAAWLAPDVRTPGQIALFAALCLSVALVSGLLLHAAFQVLRPTVRTATGSLRRSGDPRHPRLQVGDVELHISFRRWKRLPSEWPGLCRAYYDPAHNLLSAEPWSDTQAWTSRSSS